MIEIRTAIKSDIPSIKKLNHLLVDYDRQFDKTIQPHWIESEDGKQFLEERLHHDDSVVFIADNDNQVVGYLIGCVTEAASYRTIKWLGELEEMFVLPEFRSQYLGKQLVTHFVNWCKNKNLTTIKVEVSAGNERGLHFYRQNDFIDFNFILERTI